MDEFAEISNFQFEVEIPAQITNEIYGKSCMTNFEILKSIWKILLFYIS